MIVNTKASEQITPPPLKQRISPVSAHPYGGGSLKIAIIAGEASGDQLGGWLMAALKAKRPDIAFVGLGGPMMEAQGLASIFPIRDIALIGIAEVLPHVRTLTRRINQTVEFLERERPDVIVTIDVPGFALRVLKKLHARLKTPSPTEGGLGWGRHLLRDANPSKAQQTSSPLPTSPSRGEEYRPKLVHYVAPTVWAYRPKRAKIVAERYDHLLCLLPFEPPYFEAEGLATSYIGHEIAWWWKSRGDGATFRTHHGIATQTPLLAVFPGSRNGEINRIWPVFKKSIERLKTQLPTLEVVIQVPTSLIPRMQAETAGWGVKALILPNTSEKKNLFAAATAALAKSGTIGLECALAGLPSIIAYRANALSVFLLRRMIKIPYVNLANILAGKMVVPELLQEDCTPEKLTTALLPLLTDATAREAQRTELTRIANQLGTSDTHSPSDKAADIILGMVK